jgi:hypothetical protein
MSQQYHRNKTVPSEKEMAHRASQDCQSRRETTECEGPSSRKRDDEFRERIAMRRRRACISYILMVANLGIPFKERTPQLSKTDLAAQCREVAGVLA